MTVSFKIVVVLLVLPIIIQSKLYPGDSKADCKFLGPRGTFNHKCGMAITTLLRHFTGIWHDKSLSLLTSFVLANAATEAKLQKCTMSVEYVSTVLESLNTKLSSSINSGSNKIDIETYLACLYAMVVSKYCLEQHIVCKMFDKYLATIQQSTHYVSTTTGFSDYSKENKILAHKPVPAKLKIESEILEIINSINSIEQFQKLQNLFRIISEGKNVLNVEIVIFSYLINNVLPSAFNVHQNDPGLERIRYQVNERLKLIVDFLVTNIGSESLVEFMLPYNSKNASVYLKNGFMPVIEEVIQRIANDKSNDYVAKVMKFSLLLEHNEHIITLIKFISDNKPVFSDYIAIAEKFKQSGKLTGFKKYFPKTIQNLVWGSTCYVKDGITGYFMYTHNQKMDKFSFYRAVLFENQQTLQSEWVFEPVENTGGMIKIRNTFFDEYLSARYPYTDIPKNATRLITTDTYTACDYHFLWRVEAVSGGLWHLVHNSTNLKLNLGSSDNKVPYLTPNVDYVFELVCSALTI